MINYRFVPPKYITKKILLGAPDKLTWFEKMPLDKRFDFVHHDLGTGFKVHHRKDHLNKAIEFAESFTSSRITITWSNTDATSYLHGRRKYIIPD